MDRLIIGLVGPIASGKGILSDYLTAKGFIYEKISDRLRDEAIKRGLEVTRKNLQDIGNELRLKHGNHILAQLTLLKNQNDMHLCIDGVRNPGEVNLIKNNGGLIIGVTAPTELRLSWYLERAKQRIEDGSSVETFNISNDRDLGKGEDASGQQVMKCLEMADFLIENTGTIQDLLDALKRFLFNRKQYDVESQLFIL